ncbi:MAG: phosphoribosylamine--glycine ligase [Methylocystis sp.]|nr:phosphoribosylamine--glycine ligase [Methylocystis sp.]
MNVLLIGSGGREHAICNALKRSPLLTGLYIAPGNPGTARVGDNVDLDVANHPAVIDFCREAGIALVVVGPEQPLIGGLVDELEKHGILAFGPTQAAAQLEGSKGFTKDLCRDYRIPTASYAWFAALEPALTYLREHGAPIVVKADGLAAGKGVVVARTLTEAERAAQAMFGGAFGLSGAEVVIEECLEGEEASFFAICDGVRALPFATAQDHKRVGEGDTGPNTGGMGAYSPASVVTPEIEARVMAEIIEPTMRAMRDKGAPFKGVLYAGLSDLLELMLDAARGELPQQRPRFSPLAALTVVLAAKNYPGTPMTGSEIRNLECAEAVEAVTITHAGTREEGGRLLAAGGRVLNVTAMAEGVAEAQARAYAAVDLIDWPGGFCRRDIGWREVAREGKAS